MASFILFNLVFFKVNPLKPQLRTFFTMISIYYNYQIASGFYRKIPKISHSKYKPPKPVTQKTLR